MTNIEIEKGFQEIWNLFKETDQRFKETDQRIKETNDEINRTSKAVNALTGKWGKFVENSIAPSVIRLFKEREIKVDTIYQRVKKQKNGFGIEIDILAINGEYAVLIEAKSTLRIEDVDEHLERLKNFKGFFPEYQDRKVIGAVGALAIEEKADKYAYRKGLFIIVERGESVAILNDEKFKPQIW
ncbi:MAG: DUF3782 domain-containing protein [bacterium]